MATRLDEVLQGKQDNYILPLFWQRGEDEAIIREEMARIRAAGIHAVCVEARPHPDFLGPRWWQDMDVIMDEARNHAMRVWILDDDHFPTGHAAGKMKGAPPELRRQFIHEYHLDAIGPQQAASFPLGPWLINPRAPRSVEGMTLVAAIAARRDPDSDHLTGELVDLTLSVRSGVLHWDIPSGIWRIFWILSSFEGGSEGQKDYINPIVPESVRVLIESIYEPFYARYSDDIGRTLAGFFSDEPGFYNDRQTFDYQSGLGKKGVALPWSGNLLELLTEKYGGDYREVLPLLWHDGGVKTSGVRYTYMDVVSSLYAEHFTQQIGEWCRSHGLEYIGHVLEDNGVHARLGAGAGHYFRALWGQDMAGLDVVLWQLVPGFDQGPFTNIAGDADGEFFHYGLAKMGSSLGHLDPKKKGRTLCEVFGAYGWREGLKLMKWITDHMLVRGVNHFAPHAFSQAEFPDPDCPPHMDARGFNPQFRYYQLLNQYTNRISHLLSGGLHVASVAVLYHAEAEWSGAAMPFQKPVAALMRHQLDCDVLPGDILLNSAWVIDSKLKVGEETYKGLVLPYGAALPTALLARLENLADRGLPLFFVNGLPLRSSEGSDESDVINRLAGHEKVQCVTLGELAGRVIELGFHECETENNQPYLRSFHIRHPGLDVFMFFNEHPYQAVNTKINLAIKGVVMTYDALSNTVSRLESVQHSQGIVFPLFLHPYETTFIIAGESLQNLKAGLAGGLQWSPDQTKREQAIEGPWSISTATGKQYPDFETWGTINKLADMSEPGALPDFSGTFRYQTKFNVTDAITPVWLDLGEAYETAEVWVNDRPAGIRLCPPYQMEISGLLQPGVNKLTVDVTNTLVKSTPDFFSRFAHQEPSGLLGPVRLLFSQ